MKVAVTGASGHIGANLCRMLIERGIGVRALMHNDSRGLAGLPAEFVKGDIRNESHLAELCRGADVVFNLAACVSIKRKDNDCEELNTRSTTTLLEAAKKTGVRRIIHFSSIHAFEQHPADDVLDETRPLALESPVSYEKSKAVSQKFMEENCGGAPEVIILNPTSVMGPFDFKPSLVGTAIIRFFKGQNPCLIPGGYDWVDVRDVCNAAINAIDKGRPGEAYLLAGHWKDLHSIADSIEKMGGRKAPSIMLPFWLAYTGAFMLNMHARIRNTVPLYSSVSLLTLKNGHRNISCVKAGRELGFTSRPFEDTITDTVKWFRENRYL